MMSVAEGGAGSRSGGRLLWLALVISLALNAFVVGTLVWWVGANRPTTPAERFQQIARELKLNDDQRYAFQQFVIAMRRNTRQLRDNNVPLVDKVWEEMSKAPPDRAAIDRLVDQATDNRRAYQKSMTEALTRFLGNLSAEQRGQFVELTKRHQDQTAQHLRRLMVP
jgi:Spy/CpxP family protein refolding chaperone